jgi:hypothetical protein
MIPRPRVSALPSPRPSRIRSPLAPRLCAASTRRAWRVLRPACAPRVARTSMPRCEPWIADDRFQLGYEQGNLPVPCPGRGLGELAGESAGALFSRSSNHGTEPVRESTPCREQQVGCFSLDAHGQSLDLRSHHSRARPSHPRCDAAIAECFTPAGSKGGPSGIGGAHTGVEVDAGAGAGLASVMSDPSGGPTILGRDLRAIPMMLRAGSASARRATIA